jgi:mono/diheme cytochrome c family protein
MKIVLTLFTGLLLVAMPLFAAYAEEARVNEAPNEDAPLESTSADEAEALFAGRCAMCHQLPEPAMLKPKQWKLILVTMQQRMQQANVPPLQVQEHDMILEYLTARARQ